MANLLYAHCRIAFFLYHKNGKLVPDLDCSSFMLILFFAGSFLVSSCSNKNSGLAAASVQPAKAYAVITATPRKTVIYSEFPANIQGQQNVEIRPKIDGYMQAIYVDEGAVVKKGQLLFKIEASSYQQNVTTALANIKIAQAGLNAAQMQVNQVTPLVQKDIISKYALQSAQYTLQSKQAALAQANAMLSNARLNLSYATIYSPADGVVGIIPFKIGSLVSSTTTQPLTTVSNIKNIYAYFSINEKQQLDFLANTKGKTLEEKLASLPPVLLMLSNGSPYYQQGRIETIGGMVNTATGSVSFRATFSNPTGLIRSGSSAMVRIPQTVDAALLVPQSATYQIQGKLFVYVAAPDSTIHPTAIQVNSNTPGHSYVVEQGLTQGDKIVVEGIGNLQDGLHIIPKLVNADSTYKSL
jgi:membrane fusion protein (multidrug efflux system)